ncbi:MAG: serine protease [Alphaproteobacteria bacterium RIFCSPHIGHO2_12_FULL_45_9]|nr:MAG: serine protease [Alphaproteobacteria bacterium RIFCSPHIGHO2_02_FULL_46_13]OFW99028.1 MAG: serine protease [Alphaproteobacteria bacterium RIFCSPHIGHO2_12_FULL_45_9]
MNKIALALCTATFLSPFAFPHTAQAGFFDKKEDAPRVVVPPSGAPLSFADLAETLSPAVVNISSTQKAAVAPENLQEIPQFPPGSPFEDFFKDFMQRQQGQMNGQNGEAPVEQLPSTAMGSGFIVDAAKGLVVTNNHVIKDADEIRVTLVDNTILDAELVGRDEKTDLAVLKVKNPKKHKLVEVSFGDSDKMRVGDWVLAIGNPFGLGGTVTQGIISARKRDISAGPYDDFIQTDASINRGNSGGPMFNLNGDVIGINTAIYSPTGGSVGIGFAIPANLAKPVVMQLAEFGKTRRGWLGVKIQTVTDEIADGLGLKDVHGALVASVTPGGPAEKGNIKAGDVITEFNGQKLDAMRQLPRIVAETPIGKEADVTLIRDGKTITTKVKVGELEKAETDGVIEKASGDKDTKPTKGLELKDLNITINNISPLLRETYNIPEDVNGVVVTSIKMASDAAQKGLAVGDVIVEVNQEAVKDAASVEKIVNAVKAEGKSSVLMLVDNQGQGDVRFVALKFKTSERSKDEQKDTPLETDKTKAEPKE